MGLSAGQVNGELYLAANSKLDGGSMKYSANALIVAGILVSAGACYQPPAVRPEIAALERQPPPPTSKSVRGSPGVEVVSALEAVSTDSNTSRSAKSALVDKIRSVKAVHGFPGVDLVLMEQGGFAVKIHSSLVGPGEPLYVIDGQRMTLSGNRGIDWFKREDIAH